MKKWIFVVVLYGLGVLLLFDIYNNHQWLREFVINPIVMHQYSLSYYVFVIATIVPLLLLLMNYFVLRVRAKNPVFTFVNAIFISLLVLVTFVNANSFGIGTTAFLGATFFIEKWKLIWEFYPVLFVACGFNLISGIVISEAKKKGTYLTAEFIYLLTGFLLIIFVFTRMSFYIL